MADLSVTDVQEHLRHYAQGGHDILSHPNMVHVQGTPYGMVVGHNLYITDTKNRNVLNSISSFIMQKERPLITHIMSRFHSDKPTAIQAMQHGMVHNSPVYLHSNEDHALYFPDPRDSTFQPGVFQNVHEAISAQAHPDFSLKPNKHVINGVTRQMTAREHANFDHKEALSQLLWSTPPFKGLVHVHHVPNPDEVRDVRSYTYDPQTEKLIRHG